MVLHRIPHSGTPHGFRFESLTRLAVAALLALLLPSPARAQWATRAVGLSNTTTPSSIAFDVNDSGQVVGEGRAASGAVRAFIWEPALDDGVEIPTLPGGGTNSAQAISNKGQVAGHSATPGGTRAFLWSSAAGALDLGVLGSSATISPLSRAQGINESGVVVGASTTATSISRAFRWTPGEGLRDLGTIAAATTTAGAISVANDVNDSGVVVGSSQVGSSVSINTPSSGPRREAWWISVRSAGLSASQTGSTTPAWW